MYVKIKRKLDILNVTCGSIDTLLLIYVRCGFFPRVHVFLFLNYIQSRCWRRWITSDFLHPQLHTLCFSHISSFLLFFIFERFV